MQHLKKNVVLTPPNQTLRLMTLAPKEKHHVNMNIQANVLCNVPSCETGQNTGPKQHL